MPFRRWLCPRRSSRAARRCVLWTFEFAFSFFSSLAPTPARLSPLTHTPFLLLAGNPAKPRAPGRVPRMEPTSPKMVTLRSALGA